MPADLYTRSLRVYRGLEDLTYPFHHQTLTVTHCGRICFKRQKVNLSQVFAGQNVGVTQVGERIWLVTFMHYDLGYFWRLGRAFFRCSRCHRLATRLYLPLADSWPACRRCWGLTYASRRANYNVTGFLWMLGSFAAAETVSARERRREAAAARYAERRIILADQEAQG